MEEDWGEGKGETAYQGSRHGDHPPLVACLHHGTVNTDHGVRKRVEVTAQYPVRREVIMQDIEELHQPRGNVLRDRQVAITLVPSLEPLWRCLWWCGARVQQALEDVRFSEGRVEGECGGEIAYLEVA